MTRSFFSILIVAIALLVACQSEQVEPEVDCTVSGLTLSLVESQNASCGASDGSVTLTASGGEGTLMYSMAGSEPQETGVFENIPAGNHEFTVTDENNCSDALTVSISNLDGVEIASVEIQPSGCKEENGTITIEASAGASPYEFNLDGGSFQSGNMFTGVAAGAHTVVVRDSQDCQFSENVEILTGVSFDNDVAPIISSNCAISGCHNGTQAPDFRSFANIQSSSNLIRSMTQSGQMPEASSGLTLSQSQIDLIACWVDDGALNN